MPFGALSASQQVLVRLHLLGGPEYRAQINQAALATRRLAMANAGLATAMTNTTKKSFALNQATFMARRGLFYLTMGVVGAGIAIAKLGFDYANTMQQASVALNGFLKNQTKTNAELRELYIIAAKTPFEFGDIVLATRRLFSFTEDLKLSNNLIEALTNGLSAMGILTGQSLQRASLALAHMFAIGTLNGQVLLQLNRDNVQMTKALRWYYHATGEEVKKSVSKGLITATDAAKAFILYMKRPGFDDAAWRQSNKTLYGAWTTFKDLVAMGSAGAQGGMFEAIRSRLQKVNEELVKMAKSGKDVGLTDIAESINRVISPRSNAVINFFILFEYWIKATAGALFLFAKAISTALWPLDKLTSLFGANRVAAKVFGIALGILTSLFLVQRAAVLLAEIAIGAYKAVLIGTRIALNLLAFSLGVETRVKVLNTAATGAATAATTANTGATATNTAAQVTNMQMARQLAAVLATKLVLSLRAAKIATWEFTAALLAGEIVALPVLGIVAAIVLLTYVLVVLYFKWKAFHDLVNRTASFMWKNWAWVGPLLMATGPIGWMVGAVGLIVKYWSQIVGFMKQVYELAVKIVDIITKPWQSTAKGIFGFVKSAAGIAGKIGGYALPPGVPGSHQMGGIHAGGFAWVGERGPELVQMPGGSRITPNAQVEPVDWRGYGGGGDNKPIVVNLVVDRKVLATAVARANQDYASRR